MAGVTLDWLNLIVLLGAVQGVFLAGALATKKRNRTANRLLAAAMLTFSLGLFEKIYYEIGLMQAWPHLFGMAYGTPFLYGPLVYLYAVTAADRDRGFRPTDVFHFLPFAMVVAWGMPIYLMSGADKIALFHQMRAGHLPLLIKVADPLKFVSGITYAVVTLVFLRRHRERVKDSYSSTEQVNLRWLFWLGSSAAAIWTLATTLNILDAAGVIDVDASNDIVSLAVTFLVYVIGYRGLRQPEVFRYETAEFPVPVPAPKVAAVQPDARYERSGLSDVEAKRLENSLKAAMDKDQPWKNPDLTLADLAEKLGTTPHKLSEVLNSLVGETFYDFVNGYRVREVQRRIAAGDARSLKILSLAMDAGFSSKSTFNQVFKKHAGETPSGYRAKA